jgi:hypothetical protein
LRIVAAVLTVWIAWRWLGFVVGLVRLRRYEKGPVRREARRTVVVHGALDVFLSVGALYLWASVLEVQPSDTFVGFLAATMMCSLAVGVASWLMQPQERTPSTIGLCSVTARLTEPSPPT